jgi:hypothetical protein
MTTMTMATVQQEMPTTTMTTDIKDDDDKGDDASLTKSDEGDNRNRNDIKDACTWMATTPAHWQWQ